MTIINMDKFVVKKIKRGAAVAVIAVVCLAAAGSRAADGSAVAARKDTMSEVKGILEAVVKAYEAAPSYDAEFFLQQPRTPKDLEDGELMLRLREDYRLLYRRGKGGPDASDFRLEGVHGTNQGTVAVWSSAEGKMTIYRPNFRPMKLSKKDERIVDLFVLDTNVFAKEFLKFSREPGVGAGLGEEKCPKEGVSGGKAVCHVVVLTGPGGSMKGYVNAGSSMFEMVEISKVEAKGNKVSLAQRVLWHSFKARDITDGELKAKPSKK